VLLTTHRPGSLSAESFDRTEQIRSIRGIRRIRIALRLWDR